MFGLIASAPSIWWKDGAVLSCIASSFNMLVVERHRSHRGLRFTHVRSHTNNTSNELTDRVADLARRGVTINGSPEIIPFEIPLGDRSALPSLPVAFDAD